MISDESATLSLMQLGYHFSLNLIVARNKHTIIYAPFILPFIPKIDIQLGRRVKLL